MRPQERPARAAGGLSSVNLLETLARQTLARTFGHRHHVRDPAYWLTTGIGREVRANDHDPRAEPPSFGREDGHVVGERVTPTSESLDELGALRRVVVDRIEHARPGSKPITQRVPVEEAMHGPGREDGPQHHEGVEGLSAAANGRWPRHGFMSPASVAGRNGRRREIRWHPPVDLRRKHGHAPRVGVRRSDPREVAVGPAPGERYAAGHPSQPRWTSSRAGEGRVPEKAFRGMVSGSSPPLAPFTS
jgi:hypothetical protein